MYTDTVLVFEYTLHYFCSQLSTANANIYVGHTVYIILCNSPSYCTHFCIYTTYCMYNRNNVSVMTFFFLAVF